MLNLHELEKKLDQALASETQESLTNWLEEKRLRSFLGQLGDGRIDNLQEVSNNIKVSQSFSFVFKISVQTIPVNDSYLIAA
jgi:hypothetical protein